MNNTNEIAWTAQQVYFMTEALKLAQQGAQKGEVPVGAVIVYQGEIISRGYNCCIQLHDPSAHAEIQTIRQAGLFLQNYRLTNCDLYVTIEPCTMCAGAIIHGRIRNLFYGADEPKAGVVKSQSTIFSSPWFNHKVNVYGGLLTENSQQLLQKFFKSRRKERIDRKKST